MSESNNEAQEHRLAALSSFLTAQRKTASPEKYGFTRPAGRNTPGLRRIEVAQLVGVSLSWYTQLEQGRPIKISFQLAESIADVYDMSHAEKDYFLTLVGLRRTRPVPTEHPITRYERRMVELAGDNPAHLLSPRYDILLANEAFYAIQPSFARRPRREQNLLWLMFTDPDARTTYVDWEYGATMAVAQFRDAAQRYLFSPPYQELITQLKEASPEFCDIWEKETIMEAGNSTRTYFHPEVGKFTLEFTKLSFEPRHDISLVIQFAPPDSPYWKLLALHKAKKVDTAAGPTS